MNSQSSTAEPRLHVVMYHYVRDLANTRFPRIKGMRLDEFRKQIASLSENYEFPSLDVALEFLRGNHRASKDMCMLTFDDGLKEHYTDVLPILSEYKIQGMFGVITSCVEDHIVAPVHMNHFLMAELDFGAYRDAFMQLLEASAPEAYAAAVVDPNVAQRSYPLDSQEVATFKFLFNFVLEAGVRDTIVTSLFETFIGDQRNFAEELYMSWSEIRELQNAGMLVAGHTHAHRPLSGLNAQELAADLGVSRALLDANLNRQNVWPFSYPYGKKNSYSRQAIGVLQGLKFDCAFNTEHGSNTPHSPVFELQRIDCKDAVQQLRS